MSFYNFKLNDPSTFSTSTSPDTKSPGRFVHKTFQDYQSKSSTSTTTPNTSSTGLSSNVAAASSSSTGGAVRIASKGTAVTDGRGKFSVPGWKEKGVIAPGGERSRFRLNKPSESLESSNIGTVGGGQGGGVDSEGLGGAVDLTHTAGEYSNEFDETEVEDGPLQAISITNTLQSISRTYSPLQISTLHSLSQPTSIRLVKLAGQSSWHTHHHTDEIFILLRGAIEILYRGGGEEKVARCIGGELLRVPRGMEHCVVAEEGTEVILLEGSERVGSVGK